MFSGPLEVKLGGPPEGVAEAETVVVDAGPLPDDVDEVRGNAQQRDNQREEGRDSEHAQSGRVNTSDDQKWNILWTGREK